MNGLAFLTPMKSAPRTLPTANSTSTEWWNAPARSADATQPAPLWPPDGAFASPPNGTDAFSTDEVQYESPTRRSQSFATHNPVLEDLASELDRLTQEAEDRETQIASLLADVESLKSDRDQTRTQLNTVERSCRMLAMQITKLLGHAAPAPADVTTQTNGSKALRTTASVRSNGVPPTAATTGVAVVHFDAYEPYRSSIQTRTANCNAAYCDSAAAADELGSVRRLNMINLLSPGALRWISDQARYGTRRPSAFTYCGDGKRGLVLGMVDYLPLSSDLQQDVDRILGTEHSPKKLLIVGGDFDVSSRLQDGLIKRGARVSTALTGRQAIEFAPTIRPDLVLIDLNLPKESVLRIAYQLRYSRSGDPRLPIAFFWRPESDMSEFGEQVTRAIYESPLSSDELGRVATPIVNAAAAA